MATLPRIALLIFVTFNGLAASQAQDGLYADFATSMGSFTCKLHFDKVPRTVANFVGLAVGERAWLDLITGEAKRHPFYNGIIFHRVVSGFVIQAGSPNTNGTDGPGYHFRDEFDATLRHDKAGILSMANSGRDSNGSQFFTTLAPTSHLDNVHSVFGEVSSGMEVVTAIGGVPVGANSKPVTPVVINSVTIRRVGAAAAAFNAATQALPTIGGGGPRLVQAGANFSLHFPPALSSEYLLYESDNLATWTQRRIGLYITTPPTGQLDVTATFAGKSQHFCRLPQIVFPGPIYTEQSLLGKRLVLTFSGGQTWELTFDQAGTGTSVFTDGANQYPGTITRYIWTPEAYRASRFFLDTTNLVDFDIFPYFTSTSGGTFKATVYTTPSQPASGTFTLNNAP